MAKEKDWWEPWHTPEEEEELILNTERDIAMRKGMEKGRTEGIEEGMKKGHAKGIAEGLEQANISAIENMARENISADVISRCVKMPLEKVNKILASIML